MFRGSVKSTGYPLYSPVSPSLRLPCVTVCHHIWTRLYTQYWLAYRLAFIICFSFFLFLSFCWKIYCKQSMNSISLCRPTSALHVILAHKKHPQSDYTYSTVHTIYTATKLITSMYCNYNRRHRSQSFIDCTLSSTVTIIYVHILIYWLYWVWYLHDL